MRLQKFLARIAGIILVASALPALAGADTLAIGTIGDEPLNEIKLFSPIARYLAKQLETHGVTRGRVVIAGTIHQMAGFMKQGRVDVYIDSPLTSLAVNHLAGGEMALRRWKKGVVEYHAVIFARRDNGIASLSDLEGKIIAFEEAFSSSGHILPRIAMMRDGLTLKKVDFEDAAPPGGIGYLFSSDDENTMVWVLRNRVAAGAMSAKSFRAQAKSSIDNLSIVKKTFSIPRHVVNLRRGLSPPLKQALKKVLSDMHRSEEGRKILAAFEKTAKFDAIPPPTRNMLKQNQPVILEILDMN